MQKSAQQVPAQKQVTIADLAGVKPLLMKGTDDDEHESEHNHAEGEKGDDHHHHGEYNMHLGSRQR